MRRTLPIRAPLTSTGGLNPRLRNVEVAQSRVCLGCMTYDVPARGAPRWTVGEAAIRRAVEPAALDPHGARHDLRRAR